MVMNSVMMNYNVQKIISSTNCNSEFEFFTFNFLITTMKIMIFLQVYLQIRREWKFVIIQTEYGIPGFYWGLQ